MYIKVSCGISACEFIDSSFNKLALFISLYSNYYFTVNQEVDNVHQVDKLN